MLYFPKECTNGKQVLKDTLRFLWAQNNLHPICPAQYWIASPLCPSRVRQPLHGCHESRGGRVELSEFGRKGQGIRKTKISLLGAQWVKGASIYLSLMPSSGSWKYWVSNLEFMNSWIIIQQFNNHSVTFLVCCSCARWLIYIFLLYLQVIPMWQVLLPKF